MVNLFFTRIRLKVLYIFSRFLSDRRYLELLFSLKVGYKLNLDNPRTFNEKLQWLKLNDHRMIYTIMVDKVAVKQYVANIIGEKHIIPTIAVYDKVEDIDFNVLPNQFVLKCSHDSGGIVICKDKNFLNIKKAIKTLRYGLKKNFFYQSREYPYKNVKPRIICEKYMVDESGVELKDYKWFCFDGKPQFMFIATDRGKVGDETKFDFFDLDFNHLPIINGHPNASKNIVKPKSFELMKELAAKLSQGIPHVRVDFYDINGHIYFGEMTFFHWSGLKPFEPVEWDYRFGEFIKIPQRNNCSPK